MKKNEKRIMDGRSILGEICKSIKSIVYCVISVCLKIYFETLANVVQRTELYNQFLQDTGTQKTQKAFSDDMVKCHIYEKTKW